jgi:hypothetical protein
VFHGLAVGHRQQRLFQVGLGMGNIGCIRGADAVDTALVAKVAAGIDDEQVRPGLRMIEPTQNTLGIEQLVHSSTTVLPRKSAKWRMVPPESVALKSGAGGPTCGSSPAAAAPPTEARAAQANQTTAAAEAPMARRGARSRREGRRVGSGISG